MKDHQYLENSVIFKKGFTYPNKNHKTIFLQVYLCTICAVLTKSVRLDILRNEFESS